MGATEHLDIGQRAILFNHKRQNDAPLDLIFQRLQGIVDVAAIH